MAVLLYTADYKYAKQQGECTWDGANGIQCMA